MFFPEIFHFLAVVVLKKLHKLSTPQITPQTILKKRTNDNLFLAFLIFKTLFQPVLFCFRFLEFLCKKLLYWQGNCWNFFMLVEISISEWCWLLRLCMLERIDNKNLCGGIFCSGLHNVSSSFDCSFA
jgi:hypothetical protein